MILFVGASASGKTEIAKYLFSHHGITKAVTHTTRPMRVGERNGIDYHFVTREEFLSLRDQGALVESTEYNGNFYGCSKAECGDDKCIVLDPSGIASFLALGSSRIVTFYLKASDSLREKRMRSRGDDEASIQRRLKNDRVTFDEARLPHIDFVIDCEEKSVAELGDAIYALYRQRLGD